MNCSLCSRDELILFGGEYNNGKATSVYNDLFIYSIAKNEWRKVRMSNTMSFSALRLYVQILAPGAPTPRSSHQAVAVDRGGVQSLLVWGGEFMSPSQVRASYRALCVNTTH